LPGLKIALAQVPSRRGDLTANIDTHLAAIACAGREGVGCLVFPELSLVGYEPALAAEMALLPDDSRLAPLVEAAVTHRVHVVAGAPLARECGKPAIGAFIFHPEGDTRVYAKMHLHSGEEQWFGAGDRHHLVELGDERLALAICADANHQAHSRNCAALGATAYLAGVMISGAGYPADSARLAAHARRHGMLVAMANHNRPTGGFQPEGKSAIWTAEGLLAAANETGSALVIAERRADRWRGKVVKLPV